MKNDNNKCWLGENCECSGNKVHSCMYLYHRFGVIECASESFKRTTINYSHKTELRNRNELLKNGKFKSGDNYNQKLNKRLKELQ